MGAEEVTVICREYKNICDNTILFQPIQDTVTTAMVKLWVDCAAGIIGGNNNLQEKQKSSYCNMVYIELQLGSDSVFHHSKIPDANRALDDTLLGSIGGSIC